MKDFPVSPLFAQLHAWAVRDFVWGECDCCTVLADWTEAAGRGDFMSHLRGMYDSPGTCQRETGFLRTPVDAFDRALVTIGGLDKTDTPRAGDIAVLMRHGEQWPFGALWTGTRWAGKSENGVTVLRSGAVTSLAIWSVGYEA